MLTELLVFRMTDISLVRISKKFDISFAHEAVIVLFIIITACVFTVFMHNLSKTDSGEASGKRSFKIGGILTVLCLFVQTLCYAGSGPCKFAVDNYKTG